MRPTRSILRGRVYVADDGRVFVLREVKPFQNGGYRCVQLEGRKVRHAAVVADAYLNEPYRRGLSIHHKDGNPENCHPANLSYWASASARSPKALRLLAQGFSREDVADALCIPLSDVPEVTL